MVEAKSSSDVTKQDLQSPFNTFNNQLTNFEISEREWVRNQFLNRNQYTQQESLQTKSEGIGHNQS